MYGGLDFLPDMYDQMLSAPNGKAFLAQKGDVIVSLEIGSTRQIKKTKWFMYVCLETQRLSS